MNLVPETWGNIAVLWQFPIYGDAMRYTTSEKRFFYGQQKGIILMLADVGRYVGSGIPVSISLYEASTYKLCIIPTIKTCFSGTAKTFCGARSDQPRSAKTEGWRPIDLTLRTY